MITLYSLTGTTLHDYIAELAALRIKIFRAFPYLYDGNIGYETKYLKTYIDAPDSLIVLAKEGEKVIGAATGIPLVNETSEVQQPFIQRGYALKQIFYCGESVLLPEYRGLGIGVSFFEHREAHAKRLGGFRFSSFCAVQRPANHPAKPTNYVPLDSFWRNRGYEKHDELTAFFRWKDLNESQETAKPLHFWLKDLTI